MQVQKKLQNEFVPDNHSNDSILHIVHLERFEGQLFIIMNNEFTENLGFFASFHYFISYLANWPYEKFSLTPTKNRISSLFCNSKWNKVIIWNTNSEQNNYDGCCEALQKFAKQKCKLTHPKARFMSMKNANQNLVKSKEFIREIIPKSTDQKNLIQIMEIRSLETTFYSVILWNQNCEITFNTILTQFSWIQWILKFQHDWILYGILLTGKFGKLSANYLKSYGRKKMLSEFFGKKLYFI